MLKNQPTKQTNYLYSSTSSPETPVTGRQSSSGPLKLSQPMDEMHFFDWSGLDLEATGKLWSPRAESEILPCEFKLHVAGKIFPEWEM